VPEEILDEIRAPRGRVLGAKISHRRTLTFARYQALTKNPRMGLYSYTCWRRHVASVTPDQL
jgi:hypothetical protein